jgi:hypothetical protein
MQLGLPEARIPLAMRDTSQHQPEVQSAICAIDAAMADVRD